jgi:DNA invertase Pin-like site-specific DNA recombinase
MPLYGYARVSSEDQDLSLQIEKLKAARCEIIRSEKRTGTTRESRRELETLLEFLRPGDTLVVTRIDRLARSVADLQDIVRALKSKSVSLKATDQPIDTASAAGKAFLDMLGVFAEFETSLRKERQMEGIAKAKAAGVYKGRRPSIDVGAVVALKSQEAQARLADFWESAGQASIGRPNRKCVSRPWHPTGSEGATGMAKTVRASKTVIGMGQTRRSFGLP